jgi:hypothetical protein
MTAVVPFLVLFCARDVKVEPNHRAEARATESHRSRELEHPISKIFYPTNTTTYQLHRDGSWFNRFYTTDVTPTPRNTPKEAYTHFGRRPWRLKRSMELARAGAIAT